MADVVMRMSAPTSPPSSAPLPVAPAPASRVQRACAACEDERVHRKESAAGAPQVTSDVAANVSALRGGGRPLPDSTRAFFEPRFGADLGRVRLHTDARAAETARSINAKAFTVGRDIAFGAGQYAPHSREGQHLLAHELTHVMQQGDGIATAPAETRIARQPAPAPAPDPPADPDAELTTRLADYMLQDKDVVNVLELSKGAANKLKKDAEKLKLDDDDLKQRLEALDKKKRSKIVADALAQVRAALKELRAETVNELAAEIVESTRDRFVALAEVARHAELEEEAALQANPKLKIKRRPQFALIRKYLLKDTIERQIAKPKVKPYLFREEYGSLLGLSKDEVLFPELHAEDFVRRLSGLTKSMRQSLTDEVGQRTLEVLPEYIQERMDTVPQAIIDEWKSLEEPVRGLFEGKINGYFSVRVEMLALFGSDKDVPATIKVINEYFTKELVKCDFLLSSGVKMTGPGNTLVHKDLNAALMKAEAFMKEPSRKWFDEVVASVSPLGYWATNVRENRNAPTRPSEHTYGYAVDINADLNPNLAKLRTDDWDFINTMSGEQGIWKQGHKERTAGAEALRNPGASTEDKMMEGMKQIRAQSAAFVATFASDSSLRARLRTLVSSSPAGAGKTPAQIDALLDLARNATKGPGKDREAAAKTLKATLEADIFGRQPIAAESSGDPSKLRDRVVKLLARNLNQLDKLKGAESVLQAQILAPADSVTADAKKHGIGPLFSRSVIKELNAVDPATRAELARVVLHDLREPLVRKSTNAEARALGELLKDGFQLLDRTTDRSGDKVGRGAGMANIAVHGFSNLNEKLVVALVHPQGGNLNWLGVVNQDMHHFQLRNPPKIPRAAIGAVPKPSDPPPPPAVAPQTSGEVDPAAPL